MQKYYTYEKVCKIIFLLYEKVYNSIQKYAQVCNSMIVYAKVIKYNMKILEPTGKVPRIWTGKVWWNDWYCTKKICYRNQEKPWKVSGKYWKSGRSPTFFLFSYFSLTSLVVHVYKIFSFVPTCQETLFNTIYKDYKKVKFCERRKNR